MPHLIPLRHKLTVSDSIPLDLLNAKCAELARATGVGCFINGLDSDMASLKDAIVQALS